VSEITIDPVYVLGFAKAESEVLIDTVTLSEFPAVKEPLVFDRVIQEFFEADQLRVPAPVLMTARFLVPGFDPI
jgi:hypothetical protein